MSSATRSPFTLEAAREMLSRDSLANWIGFQLDELEPGRVMARMLVEQKHIAPNGFLHASVIIALADTACGFGSAALLRGSDEKFTTIELKTNHLGTALEGQLLCKATARHAGSSTHVWDADVVVAETRNPIMVFRCTQMVLRSR
ncbi:MAG: PaaI family thioesterase [Desulfovibrionaceae bacterium]|nr:PaaI family thioesterase [Desulfovibrionaceae bacterium]